MSSIKVTVIIPSLNTVLYMRQCLESVRIQTLAEIEILCVDAGSTDGTLSIIQEYADSDIRVRLLVSDRPSYGYQVNLGIDAAKGEYIGIVEPDDYITEDMFEKLYAAAHDNGLDYIKSNFYKFMDYLGRRHYQKWERTVWSQGNEQNHFLYHTVILLKQMPQALVYGDHGNIWTGIYKREFLLDKKIKLNVTPGASYQDTGFALLCTLEAERVMFVDDCFYRYRQSGAGSSVASQTKHSEIIAEYAWIWEQMKLRGFTDEVSKAFYMAMKFHSYLWNYNRLYPEERRKFLSNLRKEAVLDFDERLISFTIPEKDKMLALWSGNWQDMRIRNKADTVRRNRAQEILGVFKRASCIVIVCAGERGLSWLHLNEKLGTRKICAVCDNNAAIHGKCVEEYEIISVEEAAALYPDGYYVIANKRHAEALQQQLIGLGIRQEQIFPYREKVTFGNEIMKFLLLEATGQ